MRSEKSNFIYKTVRDSFIIMRIFLSKVNYFTIVSQTINEKKTKKTEANRVQYKIKERMQFNENKKGNNNPRGIVLRDFGEREEKRQ